MKKLIAPFLIAASIISIKAQDNTGSNSGPSLKGGIKISPSIDWLKTDIDNPDDQQITNNGAKFGISYGVFTDYFFNPNYGLSVELRIAHIGGDFTYSATSGTYTVERNLHMQYLEIPLTIKMRTNEVGYLKYFGQFGFVPAINLKAKGDITTTLHSGGASTVIESKKGVNLRAEQYNEANTFLSYLLIGVGAEYNLGGSTSFVTGLTFNNGFTNIINRQKIDDPVNDPHKLKDRDFVSKPAYIALNLGVIF